MTLLMLLLAFSHRLHAVDLGLKCEQCHGQDATFPAPQVCGQCHKGQYDHEIQWAYVHKIPEFVEFSHREHLNAGNTCGECHGAIPDSKPDFSMGACMECHRVKNAGLGCNYCHAR